MNKCGDAILCLMETMTQLVKHLCDTRKEGETIIEAEESRREEIAGSERFLGIRAQCGMGHGKCP